MDWTSLLQQPGQSDGIAEFNLDALNSASNRDAQAASTDLNRFQLTAAQDQASREQRYQADAQAWIDKGAKPEGLADLQVRYPEKKEALSSAWAVRDEAKKKSDFGYMGGVRNALALGTPEGRTVALTQLRQRRAADLAAGLDTTEDDAAIKAVENNDTPTINVLMGTLLSNMSAIDPSKYSQVYGTVSKGDEGYTLGPGNRRFDRNNKQVAEAPFAPRDFTLGPGQSRFSGGDDPNSPPPNSAPGSGTPLVVNGVQLAPGGRTRGGWTPWAGNGGDNSTQAYVGKINGMATALGVGPNDDISKLDPMTIAKALTLSEGGPGSLADKNNNPGNIKTRDGKSFVKFPSKEAGLAAAAGLVRRKLKNGQTTIATLVGGLPVGGPAPQSGGAQPIASVPATPKEQFRILTAQEKAANNLPDNIQYQISPTGQITPVGGMNTANTRSGEGAFRKEFEALPEVKTFKAVRPQFNTIRTLATKANPTGSDDIALIFAYMKLLDPTSVVREGEFATAQNSAGIPDQWRNAYNRALSGTRLNPDQRKNMLTTANTYYGNYRSQYNTAADQYRGYARDAGLKPDNVARTYTPDGTQGSAYNRNGSGNGTTREAPVDIPNTAGGVAKLKSLPPGTWVRYNGRTGQKK